MFIPGLLSFLLLVGAGLSMSYDTYLAIGLYISSPTPILAQKVLEWYMSPPSETKPPVPPTEDPVAPTAEEPNDV